MVIPLLANQDLMPMLCEPHLLSSFSWKIKLTACVQSESFLRKNPTPCSLQVVQYIH